VPVLVHLRNVAVFRTPIDVRFEVAIFQLGRQRLTWSLTNLTGGTTCTLSGTLSFPASARGTLVSIYAVADPAGVLTEALESNNQSSSLDFMLLPRAGPPGPVLPPPGPVLPAVR